MNFKSILGFTVLALIGMANATTTKTIPTVSTKTIPTNKVTLPPKIPKNTTKILPTEFYSEKCMDKSGIPIVHSENGVITYACLIEYSDNEKDNETCFHNQDSILCIDEEVTNIDFCSKSSDNYDSRICIYTVHNLASYANSSERIILDRPLITYPKEEKYVLTPREDYEDCRKKGGIVVNYQTIFQYMCFSPEESFETNKDVHCVTLNGKRYCYDDDLSASGFCASKNYDKTVCEYTINQYAASKNITVEDLE